MTKSNKIRVVSLFSGCGGGDLGIKGGFDFLGQKYPAFGFEIIWANDILQHAVDTYKSNIGNHIVNEDITKIPSEEIPDHDVLIGGFPCQSFSIVGQRGGFNDPRGNLYLEMVRIAREKQPKIFIAENVKGLISSHKGMAIKKIVEDFTSIGYKVTYQVLNASHFGIPQKRERVFIVGIRKDLNLKFSFPEPSKTEVIPLKNVYEDHGLVDKKFYFSQRAVDGMRKANKAFNKGRAQDLNNPCNTISTHLAKVSLNGTDPVFLVKKDCYRRITPIEAARIQSFPESFKFTGTDAQKYIQIGNAIPPVLMWHVAKEVKKTLSNGRRHTASKMERTSVNN